MRIGGWREWPWGLGVAALAIALGALGAFAGPDRLALDAAFRANRAAALVPVPDDIVVVGMDEAFLDSVEEPLALSHAYLARFLGVVAEARPKVVGLDVVLPAKRFDGLAPVAQPDADYHRTLAAGLILAVGTVPVVVAKAWDPDRGHYLDIQLDYVSILDSQEEGFRPLGSVLLCLDDDARVRAYPGRDCQPDRSDSTFAGEIAAAIGRDGAGGGLIDYRLGREFGYVPLQEVFRLQEAGDRARLSQLFGGKVVLLGAILDETDLVGVPVPLAEWRPTDTRVPGVLVHAQILRSLLHGELIRPVPSGLSALAVLVLALGLAVLRLRHAVFALGIVVIGVAVASVMLPRIGLWWPPAMPLAAALAVVALRAVRALRDGRARRESVLAAWAGSVPPVQLARLLRDGPPLQADGGVEAVALECEFRLPSSGTAPSPPDRLALVEAVVAIVHRHGGLVDAASGHRVTACFGCLEPVACPEKLAIEAAADIVDAARAAGGDGSPAEPCVVAIHRDAVRLARMTAGGHARLTVLGEAFAVTRRMLATHADEAPVACSPEVAARLGHPAFLRPLAAGVHGWTPPRRPLPPADAAPALEAVHAR